MESALSELRDLSEKNRTSEIWLWREFGKETTCWEGFGRWCPANKVQKWLGIREQPMWLLQFPDHQSSVTTAAKSLKSTFRFSFEENFTLKLDFSFQEKFKLKLDEILREASPTSSHFNLYCRSKSFQGSEWFDCHGIYKRKLCTIPKRVSGVFVQ